MLNKLQTIFEDITGDYQTKLTGDMLINEDLNISSIGRIQLVYAIEDKFGIEIPAKEIRKFICVNDVIEFLEKTVG